MKLSPSSLPNADTQIGVRNGGGYEGSKAVYVQPRAAFSRFPQGFAERRIAEGHTDFADATDMPQPGEEDDIPGLYLLHDVRLILGRTPEASPSVRVQAEQLCALAGGRSASRSSPMNGTAWSRVSRQ